jgi:LPXTG-site transpeptidase (sortase) family protein
MSAAKVNKQSAFPTEAVIKILLILGLLLMSIAVQWQIHQKAKLSFASEAVPVITELHRTSQPSFINIPSLQLALPVFETSIQKNMWEVSSKGISHLTSSANPGEKQTIILYSHNTNDRFGPIRWMKIGDVIRLTAHDGSVHEYIVKELVTVKPTDVEILQSHNEEILILYTCDGFADSKRFVVKAFPITKP